MSANVMSEAAAATAKDFLYTNVYDPFGVQFIEETAGLEGYLETRVLAELNRDEPEALINTDPAYDQVLVDRYAAIMGDTSDVAASKTLAKGSVVDLLTDLYPYIMLSKNERIDNPTREQVCTSVTAKLRRNVSLGVIESLACIRGVYLAAQEFAKTPEGRGEDPMRLTRRASAIAIWLGRLADEQSTYQLYGALMGISDDMFYHTLPASAVLTGELDIPPGKFVPAGPPGNQWLTLRNFAPRDPTLPPPLECPMNRKNYTTPGGKRELMMKRVVKLSSDMLIPIIDSRQA
ncbi:MAG: hypothetical protein ABWY71_03455 [Candidatus Saccharimonadales bacterium]